MIATLVELLFIRKTKFFYASFLLFAMAIGINFVTFPSILELNKISPSKIGIAFTFEILGIILMSFFLNKIVAKIGLFKSLRASSIVYASLVLIIYFFHNFIFWLLLALIIGCCWQIFVICRMGWFSMFLKDEERGIALGIFSTIISLGVAIGPMIVKIFGAENYQSFIASACLILLAFLMLSPLRNLPQSPINNSRISPKKFFQKNPSNFLARFFLDFINYTFATLAVVFGSEIGFKNESSGLFISAFMVSGFFDIIVGFILKKTSTKKMINIGFYGALCCFLMISFYQKSFIFLLLCFFIFGLFIACIYVSVFKAMNEDYPKSQLLAANSTFQLIGTCGALCGSFFGGFMIHFFGARGFPIIICLGCIFYLIFSKIYEKKST